MTVISRQTLRLLALSMLKGVGAAALRKVAAGADFGDQSISETASRVPQIARACVNKDVWLNAQGLADAQVEQARKYDARILSPCDIEYPKLLAATKDDPFILYVRGNFAKRPERSVAIIGTREPTSHGELIAVRITQFFVEQGWSIVSGLAIGCDGIAHQAALEAGGHTGALLAPRLQMITPAPHRKLPDGIRSPRVALVHHN